MNAPIQTLHQLGQSLWYDNIERRLLENGALARLIAAGDIRGVTSNPSIFQKAISKSSDYDAQLEPLARKGKNAQEIYEALAIADIRSATDLFRPLYASTAGGDGYVSLEVSPYLAGDTEGTCEEAARLWDAVGRPNLMIKIPATKAGLPAITRTIAAGINVNVTLIFSQERYVEVMEAYLAGLEQRMEAGKPLDGIASVASFFVSRIDSKVDVWLQDLMEEGSPRAGLASGLEGKMAIANARLAYARYKQIFGADRFARLKAAGARVQRPLWASTSTKNPAYPDVLYVEELIGPETVNTVPPGTLDAFRDHGRAALTLEKDLDAAWKAFADFESLGLSFEKATAELEEEGVQSFADSFTALLSAVEERRENVMAVDPGG